MDLNQKLKLATRTGLEPVQRHSASIQRPELDENCRGIEKERGCRSVANGRPLVRKLVTVLIIIAIASLWGIADLAKAQNVYWNPANSQGSGHEDLIKHAAWSWSERTGMDVTYAGQTSAVECVPNAITYRTASVAEWTLAGQAAGFDTSASGPHGWTFTCPYGGFTGLLSPHHAVSRITILHELGHGLRGFGHLSFSTGALMLSSPPVSALVTTVDADYIRNSPDWPVPNSPSYCHTEVANDLDLAIPEINGKRVRANYDGFISGYHQWTVVESLTLGTTKGCANSVVNQDGTITLNDIRSMHQSYSSATLSLSGRALRLLKLAP